MTAKLKYAGATLWLSLCFFSLHAFAQVAKIEPEQPKWGATLTITYNPKAEGAKLTAGDDIYLSASLSFADHFERLTVKMNRVGEVFKYDLPVKQNLSDFQGYFITLNDWDNKQQLSAMIYRPDGTPAKGAYRNKILSKQYREMAEKELTLYPDNYLTYRDKWFAAYNLDKANYQALVKADIERLTTEVKTPPADLLYSLSYGYMILHQEEKSREMLKALAKQSPTWPLIGSAFSNYEYEVFSQQLKGEGPEEIQKLKRELIERYQDTDLARDNIRGLAYDKEAPLAPVEAVCQKWSAQEADHPMPYLILAEAYNKRRQKMEQAATLIEKAINLMLEGKLRLHDDISGFRTGLELPRAYLTSAEIALNSQNYAKALSSVKAAQSLEKETESKSSMLEGDIWQKLGQPVRAEAAYFEAWRRGGKEAEAALRTIYEKRKGSLVGFDEYVSSKKNAMANAAPGKKPPAPFTVTSIDGEKFDLAALRGKVVVLNFWFIGCAPCRVEMPGLNQLVSEFKGKDVVFIAFATDAAEDLQTFLKEKSFNYRIIPAASKTAEAYEVNAYPTHVIIGKDGQIISRLTGGSDKRHDDLRPLIERALSSQ